MNYIYLTASTEQIEKHRKLFKSLLSFFDSRGYKNSNDYLNSLTSGMPNPDVDKKDFHSRTRKRIKRAVLLVADISDSSITIGTLIEFAISNNIPALCICDKKFKGDLPSILKHYDSKLFTLLLYDKDDLHPQLSKYLDSFTKAKIKFNAFISPEMDSYMKWYAKRHHISKSNFFRDLLQETMQKDKEYIKALGPNNNKT
jgi:hypothetical protein